MSTRLAIRGVGVLAPGLEGWSAARDVLCGDAAWRDQPVASPDVQQLPITERRRVNATSRWAIAVADEAVASLDASTRATLSAVFASADGDGDVLDQTLAALAAAEPTLSPTLFHNSVFNAPVGYWSIATRSRGWATMICGGEGSAAAALLEGASQAYASGGAVLCVCVDLGYPGRLAGLHAPGRSFACGIVLDAQPAAGGAWGSLAIGAGIVPSAGRTATDAPLAAFEGNAAAELIPVLARIARRESGVVALPYFDGQALRVEVVAP
ncbi:MAG: beta-ketoacyl synthase chain length factor [Betaproteobacteria bacterium]